MNIVTYPCLKSTMGSWVYYSTSMRISDLVEHVKYAHELFPPNDLDKVLQRKLTDRAKAIATYLENNDDRFFGSLIVAAYDGHPQFAPISLPETALLGELRPQLGILRFDGKEVYYALDGQHRLAGLKEAFLSNPERYTDDDIGVTIVCHSKDDEGVKRARRLFSTLNRYAKKTTKAEDLMMDEDNPADIFTRRLVREEAFFTMRVKVYKETKYGIDIVSGESIPISDKKHLMNILSLKRCIEGLLPQSFKSQIVPQSLPNLDSLDEAYEEVKKRWNYMIDNVAVWRDAKDRTSNFSEHRGRHGGNVLCRPIAIVAFIEACGEYFDQPKPNYGKIQIVADRYGDITKYPWAGLLWNCHENKMYDGQQKRKATLDLWRYFLGLEDDREKVERQWIAASDSGALGENPQLLEPVA